jgi:hypothetical protein
MEAPHPLRVAARWFPPVAWAGAFGAFSLVHGLPLSKEAVIGWVVVGLVVLSLSGTRRGRLATLVDWLPFAAILYAYDRLRGVADGLMPVHVTAPIRADAALTGGGNPTLWLQEHLWHGPGHLSWYDYAGWGVYLTHFFATLTVAAMLWLFAYERFRRFVAMVSGVAATGFLTYVLFPAAPPWWASEHGALGHSDRVVRYVFADINVLGFNSAYEHGSRWANDVAAMPSLHAAYALLVTLALWPVVPRAFRLLLAVYPLAMGFALVYSAEHYVVDVIFGWAYALGIFWVVSRVAERRRSPQLAVEPLENRLEPQHAMER